MMIMYQTYNLFNAKHSNSWSFEFKKRTQVLKSFLKTQLLNKTNANQKSFEY